MAKESKLSTVSPAPDMDKYMVRDAMHTIMQAREYQKDKRLMKHVGAMVSDIHKAIGASEMKSGMKGKAPKNPSNDAKGKAGLAGLKKAQAPQGKKPSKVAK